MTSKAIESALLESTIHIIAPSTERIVQSWWGGSLIHFYSFRQFCL